MQFETDTIRIDKANEKVLNPVNDQSIKDTLGLLFESLVSSQKKEINDDYGDVLAAMHERFPVNDKERFSVFVTYSIDQILEELIVSAHPEISSNNIDQFVFLYLHYSFLDNNLTEFIRNQEGFACCADKSRWLLNAYEKYLAQGIVPNMTIEEKTYWKPEFGTGEQWIALIKSIEHLYYGHVSRYIQAVQTLLACKTKQEMI